jgi:hypothetical protein
MTTSQKTSINLRKPEAANRLACSLCGKDNVPVTQCEGGHVCEDCAQKSRQGRDSTTRAVKTLQRSLRGQAQKVRAQFTGRVIDELVEFDIASSGLLAAEAFQEKSAIALVAGGEVLPQHGTELADTLAAPGAVALDASAHRLDLLTSMGTDVAAMALDAADTIRASNSLEKMLAHQLALCHQESMRLVSKAAFEQDLVSSVRMMNLSLRLMQTYQNGLLTLKRLRGTGEQHITIQHVNVTDGGQAVIGQVQAGGDNKK